MKMIGRPPLTPSRRIALFWSRVDRRKPDECWPWLAGRFTDGYGQFWDGSHNVPSHRFAWIATNGPLPIGMTCGLHRCDNRICCNPSHVFPGTNADNQADKCAKGRQARTENYPNRSVRLSFLKPNDVVEIRHSLESGQSNASLASRFGVCRGTISSIKTRRSWASL